MFGLTIVRAKWLQDWREDMHRQLAHAAAVENQLRIELELTRQSRDFFKVEKDKWEARASRFIDQVGISSATLSAPAMTEPGPTPQSELRRVMSVLGREALPLRKSETGPHEAASILGVNDGAAATAVANVLS